MSEIHMQGEGEVIGGNRYLRMIVIWGFVHGVLIGAIWYFHRESNDFFEYCTTRAYGWPLPWRIDHCLCDGNGGLSEVCYGFIVMNVLGAMILGGMVVSVVELAITKMWPCHER